MAGPYLDHVLADLGLSGVFPVLRLGMSYPVDAAIASKSGGLRSIASTQGFAISASELGKIRCAVQSGVQW